MPAGTSRSAPAPERRGRTLGGKQGANTHPSAETLTAARPFIDHRLKPARCPIWPLRNRRNFSTTSATRERKTPQGAILAAFRKEPPQGFEPWTPASRKVYRDDVTPSVAHESTSYPVVGAAPGAALHGSDPDLARVIATWPTLLLVVRTQIIALVIGTAPEGGGLRARPQSIWGCP
jgi:hypothetical protein